MVYRAPLVQISMSVQSTMVIVSIYALTLKAVSHVAVHLATDWIVIADHAHVGEEDKVTLVAIDINSAILYAYFIRYQRMCRRQ